MVPALPPVQGKPLSSLGENPGSVHDQLKASNPFVPGDVGKLQIPSASDKQLVLVSTVLYHHLVALIGWLGWGLWEWPKAAAGLARQEWLPLGSAPCPLGGH